MSAKATDMALSGSEEKLAGLIVSKLNQSTGINKVSKELNVDPAVYSEMLKGSISSAMSTGIQQIARFAISKAVGI